MSGKTAANAREAEEEITMMYCNRVKKRDNVQILCLKFSEAKKAVSIRPEIIRTYEGQGMSARNSHE